MTAPALTIAHDKVYLGTFPRKGEKLGRFYNPWNGDISWGPIPSEFVLAQAKPAVCAVDGCGCTQGLRARNAGAYGVLHLCPDHVGVGEDLHADARAAECERGFAIAQIAKDERRMMR